jgi:hypothetical protein
MGPKSRAFGQIGVQEFHLRISKNSLAAGSPGQERLRGGCSGGGRVLQYHRSTWFFLSLLIVQIVHKNNLDSHA